jgi:hypothetical protein
MKTKVVTKEKTRRQMKEVKESPAGRKSNPFREGNEVLVLWQNRWHKGVVSYTTGCGPDVHVRLDRDIGSPLEDGHGLIVGWNSTEIKFAKKTSKDHK